MTDEDMEPVDKSSSPPTEQKEIPRLRVRIYPRSLSHYGTVCVLDGSNHLPTYDLPFEREVPGDSAFLINIFDIQSRTLIFSRHFWDITANDERFVFITRLGGKHQPNEKLREEWQILSDSQSMMDSKDEKQTWDDPISATLDLDIPRPLYYFSQLPSRSYEADRTQFNYWQGTLEIVAWMQNVSLSEFCKRPHDFASLLGDCVAHHVWAIPYSKDRQNIDIGLPPRLCLDWRVRGGDCEDRSKDIVCAFEEFRLARFNRADLEKCPHLKYLHLLAQGYSAVYVEMVSDNHRCHVYVQLIPYDRILNDQGILGRKTNLPTLYVESNYRSHTNPRLRKNPLDESLAINLKLPTTLTVREYYDSVRWNSDPFVFNNYYYCHRLYLEFGYQLLIPIAEQRLDVDLTSKMNLFTTRMIPIAISHFETLLEISSRLFPSIPPLTITEKADALEEMCGFQVYQYTYVDKPISNGIAIDLDPPFPNSQSTRIPITNEYSAVVTFFGKLDTSINKDNV